MSAIRKVCVLGSGPVVLAAAHHDEVVVADVRRRVCAAAEDGCAADTSRHIVARVAYNNIASLVQ